MGFGVWELRSRAEGTKEGSLILVRSLGRYFSVMPSHFVSIYDIPDSGLFFVLLFCCYPVSLLISYHGFFLSSLGDFDRIGGLD